MNETRVLVLSDSHGNVENMLRAVELERPRMILHLGDGWHDAELLAEHYPDIPMEKVPGNCDFRSRERAERLIMICGKRIFLCHGHTQGVKTDLGMLMRTAIGHKADVVLFGHTHRPFVDIRNGIAVLNPGSVGAGRRPTYGTLTFRDGVCMPAVYTLQYT